MDTVPYVFCSSVVAICQSPSTTEPQFSSKTWQAAAKHESKKVTYELALSYDFDGKDDVWSYQITKGDESFTFAEFKALTDRHLRINTDLLCTALPNRSSFEQIKAIAAFSVPFVNLALIVVRMTHRWPQNTVLELLSIYDNSVFERIACGTNPTPVLNWFAPRIRSGLCRKLSFGDFSGVTPALQTAVRESALSTHWRNLEFLFKPKFDMQFFEELFEKPVTQKELFRLLYSFQGSELKEFRKNLQIPSKRGIIRWRRADGVELEVRDCGNYGLLEVSLRPI